MDACMCQAAAFVSCMQSAHEGEAGIDTVAKCQGALRGGISLSHFQLTGILQNSTHLNSTWYQGRHACSTLSLLQNLSKRHDLIACTSPSEQAACIADRQCGTSRCVAKSVHTTTCQQYCALSDSSTLHDRMLPATCLQQETLSILQMSTSSKGYHHPP